MRRAARAATFAALALGLAAAAESRELSVSLAAGGFSASEKAYRDIYGRSLVCSADLWFRFAGPLGVSLGFGVVSDKGVAIPIGDGAEVYPLKLRRRSVPVTAFYHWGRGAFDLRLGAGLALHSYEEIWPPAGPRFEGHKTSPRVYVALGYGVFGRLSIFASVVYDSIKTGAGSPLASDVDLGGWQFLGGLAVRLF